MSLKNKKNNVNKNNVNIDNENKDKKQIYSNTDSDMEECDKLINQLDEMEKNSESSISSKARNLIQMDKEDIRQTNEKLKQMNNDELDYLDDEKPETEKEQVISDDNDDDESKMDFMSNLNKDDKPDVDKVDKIERIRKKKPERLHGDGVNSTDWIGRLKKFSQDNAKNFYIGTAIAFLFLALLIALIIDAGNKESNKGKSKYAAEFLNIDTAPMVTTINNYYAALVNGEKDVVKKLLADGSDVTDEDVEAKCNEAKAYAELIGSSFLVTDCYVQQGVKKNEYIAYMKFQLQIKSIETPSVGIFTCYLVDESDKDKADYRISTDVNNKSSEIYKYIIKMSSCQNVTDLFAQADKELEEACEKDPQLKAIVDALENNTGEGNEDNSKDDNKENGDGETTQSVETS